MKRPKSGQQPAAQACSMVNCYSYHPFQRKYSPAKLTNIDEPMDLHALCALDHLATNYIESSKAMEAAAFAAPPQVPQAQRRRRKSRALSKIAALQRSERSSDTAASIAQTQQHLMLNTQAANSLAQPNTQLGPLQPNPPTPSPASPVAICHNCNHSISDFPDASYDL